MQEQLLDVLSVFGPNSDPVRVRDTLLAVFPDFMTAFGDTSAVLGSDFYNELRSVAVSSGSVVGALAQPAKIKQSEGAVRWAVGSLFADDPNWAGFTSTLMGVSQRLVMQPARETIDLLAQADVRSGRVDAVAWSRHVHPERAKSGKSCDFCRDLAARGPVYRSEASAGAVIGRGVDPSRAFDADGNRKSGGIGGGVRERGAQELAAHFHDDCNCAAVPTFYRRVTDYESPSGTRLPSALLPIGN